MTDDTDSFRHQNRFSSPLCFAADIAPDYVNPLGVNPELEI